MTPDRLRAKIATQWGVSSEEFETFLKISDKASAWEKYEFEKFGLGLHNSDEVNVSHPHALPLTKPPEPPQPTLPSDKEIARATWTYFLARAAWIMIVWAVFFGFMIALFGAIYLMVR